MNKLHLRHTSIVTIFFVAILYLTGCSAYVPGSADTTVAQPAVFSGGFSCNASATVTAGDLNKPNTTITLGQVTINMANVAAGGTLTIQIDGVGSFVTQYASQYTLPQPVSITTDSSGGYSKTVTVTNSADQSKASCTLSAIAKAPTSTVVVNASPSLSVTRGTLVTLSASGISGASQYSFSLKDYMASVQLSIVSNSTAQVTSSVAATVTVNVSAVGSSSASSTVTLTFTDPVLPPQNKYVSCVLSTSSASVYVGQAVKFSVASSPIGTVTVNAFDPGETFSVSIPTIAPITGVYQTAGTKRVRMVASVDGVSCNNGNPMTATVFVNDPPPPPLPPVQFGLTNLLLLPNSGSHVVGGLSCPYGHNRFASIADCRGGTCYGDQNFCASGANFQPSGNDSTMVVTDLFINQQNIHTDYPFWPSGYDAVGVAADCGSAICAGIQRVYASRTPAYNLKPGQLYIKNLWITPANTHVTGGIGCPYGYRFIGSFTDCNGHMCYGDQNVCAEFGKI